MAKSSGPTAPTHADPNADTGADDDAEQRAGDEDAPRDKQITRLAGALEELAGDAAIDARLKRISPRTSGLGQRIDGIVPRYSLDPELGPFEMLDRIAEDHGGGHFHVIFRRHGEIVKGGTIPITIPGEPKLWRPPADTPPEPPPEPASSSNGQAEKFEQMAQAYMAKALDKIVSGDGGDPMAGAAPLLESRVAGLTAEKQSLSDKLDTLRAEHAELKADVARLTSELNREKDLRDRAEREVEKTEQRMQRDLDEARRDVKDATRDANRLREELAEAKSAGSGSSEIERFLHMQKLLKPERSFASKLEEVAESSLFETMGKAMERLGRVGSADDGSLTQKDILEVIEKGVDAFMRIREERTSDGGGGGGRFGARRAGDDARPAKGRVIGGTPGAPADSGDSTARDAQHAPKPPEPEPERATGWTMLTDSMWQHAKQLIEGGHSGYAFAQEVLAWDEAEDPRGLGVNPKLVYACMKDPIENVLKLVNQYATEEQKQVLLSKQGQQFLVGWHQFWRELQAAKDQQAAGGDE